MPTFFKRIDTVFLKVTDFQKAIDWYSTVLGFSVRWVDEKGGYAALNVGETPLTLVRSTPSDPAYSRVSFNFFTPDIEGAYQHLLESDVYVEPIQADGNVKWFKFKDLEGNPLEVCYFQE
jgi:catechol 2,3-dioxygenase-like lactoylglutathione lyase family enzyme